MTRNCGLYNNMLEDAVVETIFFGEMEHFSIIIALLSTLRIATGKPLDSFEEPACSGRWKVLYHGTCETLLQQGPCGNTEWLILDNDGVPHCADRPCHLDDTRETADRLSAPLNNICVQEGDTKPCPDGMEVVLLENGQAECECQNGFVYWAPKNDVNKGACYQPFYRGPCAEGQMLFMPPFREGRVRAECRENRCEDGAVEVQLLANRTAIVVESYIGACAQLNAESSVCSRIYKRSHLTLDPHTMELTCSQEVAMMENISRNTRTTLPNRCSYGVKTTHKSDCRSAALWQISG